MRREGTSINRLISSLPPSLRKGENAWNAWRRETSTNIPFDNLSSTPSNIRVRNDTAIYRCLFINRFYKLLFLAREILPIDLMSRHRDHVYPIPSIKLSIKKSRSVILTIPTRYGIRMFECMRAPNWCEEKKRACLEAYLTVMMGLIGAIQVSVLLISLTLSSLRYICYARRQWEQYLLGGGCHARIGVIRYERRSTLNETCRRPRASASRN